MSSQLTAPIRHSLRSLPSFLWTHQRCQSTHSRPIGVQISDWQQEKYRKRLVQRNACFPFEKSALWRTGTLVKAGLMPPASSSFTSATSVPAHTQLNSKAQKTCSLRCAEPQNKVILSVYGWFLHVLHHKYIYWGVALEFFPICMPALSRSVTQS